MAEIRDGIDFRQLAPEFADTTALVDQGRRMRQDLFNPPNVRGWPGGAAWISTETLLMRREALARLLSGIPADRPFPAEIGPRVVDERAPVKVLAPEHPAFTTPNRIGEADFEGWVQERFLYGLSTFDPQYVPMLESADPGEAPQPGGQVIARLGKGTYVYTAYAWFRQLPAGVPGAYRLFANLLGLGSRAGPGD